MDTKISCIIQGAVGIVFGLLALLVPEITLATFYALFWVLLAVGIAGFLLLAITSKSDDSMFWFTLSAGLLVIGAISFFAPAIVAIIFLLLIAGVAVYSGFFDITLALTHPKTKYIFIPGMFVTGGLLLGVLIWYFPAVLNNLFLTVLGTFALIFGIFSILLGWYIKDETYDSQEQHSCKRT
ncbi:MAG: HdeD family acid-resistance protein [Methanoregula sp.]